MKPKPTADQVRAYMERHQCGMLEAKAAVIAEWREHRLRHMRMKAGELYTVEQCRDVIVQLLDLLLEDAT